MLVLEMRLLDVETLEPCPRVPAHLEEGCSAMQCRLRSVSGASVSLVLGGPENGKPLLQCAAYLILTSDI